MCRSGRESSVGTIVIGRHERRRSARESSFDRGVLDRHESHRPTRVSTLDKGIVSRYASRWSTRKPSTRGCRSARSLSVNKRVIDGRQGNCRSIRESSTGIRVAGRQENVGRHESRRSTQSGRPTLASSVGARVVGRHEFHRSTLDTSVVERAVCRSTRELSADTFVAVGDGAVGRHESRRSTRKSSADSKPSVDGPIV